MWAYNGISASVCVFGHNLVIIRRTGPALTSSRGFPGSVLAQRAAWPPLDSPSDDPSEYILNIKCFFLNILLA